MAKSKKYSKNLQKVQDMVSGNFKNKVQVGYDLHDKKRKVGEVWEDTEGMKWEQKQGYRIKLGNLPNVGIFDKQCNDCGRNCSTDKRHRDTFNRMSRCFYCQIDFEADLKSKDKWHDWVKEQEIKRWESILGELENAVDERDSKKLFDEKIANALANENIDSTIISNKK
tara:strand:+ start:25 stop:531 length:507 start_codon:yes stop_codon:yes gene_type:complete